MRNNPDFKYAYDFKRGSIKNKDESFNYYIKEMLNRTQALFKYTNLPESIPKRDLELILQNYGHVCFCKDNDGNLRALDSRLGGKPNIYYNPTISIVANPHLSKTFTIDEDCVIVRNDSNYQGLIPIFSRYAELMVENDITMLLCDIQTRVITLLEATSDKGKAQAELFIKKIIDGDLSIIGSSNFMNSINALPTNASNNHLTDIIEMEQYLKASLFNEIGLNANYNMKREAINSSEAQMGEPSLLPLIDDMLNNRKEGIEKVNAMFNTNIQVEFDSSWRDLIEMRTKNEENADKNEEDHEDGI